MKYRYLGFGLYGKATSTQTLNGESNEIQHKIKWGNDDENDDLKRYDYGVSARVGFYFDSGLDVSASYDYGIPNIASMGEKHQNEKPRVTGFAGVYF